MIETKGVIVYHSLIVRNLVIAWGGALTSATFSRGILLVALVLCICNGYCMCVRAGLYSTSKPAVQPISQVLRVVTVLLGADAHRHQLDPRHSDSYYEPVRPFVVEARREDATQDGADGWDRSRPSRRPRCEGCVGRGAVSTEAKWLRWFGLWMYRSVRATMRARDGNRQVRHVSTYIETMA